MKTILRKVYLDDVECYAVIEHDLELFKLKILKPWEMLAHEDSASYRVNRGISVPSYVSTVCVDGTDDILSTFYNIEDRNNIFSIIYNTLKHYNPLDILKDYPDYNWVFNKSGMYLESKTSLEKISLLEPFEYWRGNKPIDNRLYYNVEDTSLTRKLLHARSKPLVNTDINKYTYPVFRTVWYDTLIYTEYVILQLRALNVIYGVFSKYVKPDLKILEEPVRRTSSDVAINNKVNSIEELLRTSINLSDMYRKLQNYNDSKLSVCYKSVLKELTFKTETEIDWEVFKDIYNKYLDKYTLAILMYLRWNFIRSMIDIPEVFNTLLGITTPLGKLIVKGGEPLWQTR